MGLNFPKLMTESLAKQIAENIRQAILEGRLKVDERLPTEEELAAQFEVSRPTIREALKRLAAQNLVRSRRGPAGGTFITRPSEEELRNSLCNVTTLMVTLGEFDMAAVTEARLALETLCLEMAIERREERHLVRMAEELVLQEQAISDEEFCASDVRFHRALVDATANPVLQFSMTTVIEGLQPLMNMVVNRTREREQIRGFHGALYTALLARDLPGATEALQGLLAYLRDQFERRQMG